jgi:hypothetical protein
MFKRVPLQFISLVILFTFCQVIGTMCALPDLAEAEETAILVEENMACPMDGTIMYPPSAISSPERQLRQAATVHLDLAPLLSSAVTILPAASNPTPWSWSSVLSIVPISIASPSVLRI